MGEKASVVQAPHSLSLDTGYLGDASALQGLGTPGPRGSIFGWNLSTWGMNSPPPRLARCQARRSWSTQPLTGQCYRTPERDKRTRRHIVCCEEVKAVGDVPRGAPSRLRRNSGGGRCWTPALLTATSDLSAHDDLGLVALSYLLSWQRWTLWNTRPL